jgi:sugar/nucleoside kinase (ribokinase family)
MRQHITALTHPLTDLIVPCSRKFLSDRELKPGSYGLLSEVEQDALLNECHAFTPTISPGGSAANSVQAARLLGVAGSVIGLVGDDRFGHTMREDLEHQGIAVPLPPVANARTGTCVSLITPDGERTMRTCLGVARDLGARDLSVDLFKQSSWLLIEGYFLTASESNAHAILEAISIARAQGIKIAFSTAAEFVVEAKREEIQRDIMPYVDLLIANEGEARALANVTTAQDALVALRRRVSGVVITCGKDGAIGSIHNDTWNTPASEPRSEVIDTTGAGDVFAGAFLAGITRGLSPQHSAVGAARLAAEVITQRGARLPSEAYSWWRESTGL